MAARKGFTEEQIIAVLKEADAGMKTADLCRKHNVSDATFYKWKAKYAGLEVSDLRRMRGLEDENRRLKQIVANQALDLEALKALTSKNFLSPRSSDRSS
jgi:putative transposase